MKAGSDEWAKTADAIRRIVESGDRDVWSLTEGLSRTNALIVRKILEALAEDGAATPSSSTPPAQAPQEEVVALQELLALVMAGCRGNAQAKPLAKALAQGLQQPDAPPEMQALGIAFSRLLAGERDCDQVLDGLPPELGDIVDVVLAALERKTSGRWVSASRLLASGWSYPDVSFCAQPSPAAQRSTAMHNQARRPQCVAPHRQM